MAKEDKILSEIIKSGEFRDFFRELLDEQTKDIVKRLKPVSESMENAETKFYKEQYESYKEQYETVHAQYVKSENDKRELEKRLSTVNEDNDNKRREIAELTSHISQLQEQEEEKDRRLEAIEEEKDRIQERSQFLEEKCKSADETLSDLKKELESYKNKFDILENALQNYLSLSEESKIRLRNIFPKSSLYSLIVSGSEMSNIEGLWSYIKRRIIERDTVDVEALRELLAFMIDVLNSSQSEMNISKVSPEIGEKFDSDLCRIIGIETDGFIKCTKLFGLKDEKTGRIIQKALVEV